MEAFSLKEIVSFSLMSENETEAFGWLKLFNQKQQIQGCFINVSSKSFEENHYSTYHLAISNNVYNLNFRFTFAISKNI